MDFEMIATLSALVGVAIAIFALVKQQKDAHISLGVQLLRDLDLQFEWVLVHEKVDKGGVRE